MAKKIVPRRDKQVRDDYSGESHAKNLVHPVLSVYGDGAASMEH
jgi:hypothetical protein